jgi:hypothetical protein
VNRIILPLSICAFITILAAFFIADLDSEVLPIKPDSLMYFNASKGRIIGRLSGINNYSRLPSEYQEKVSKKIWGLSKNPAGLSILFSTNSPEISIRWKTKQNSGIPTHTRVVSNGFDLYCYTSDTWKFVGSFSPSSSTDHQHIISGLDSTKKDFLLNLPLFGELKNIEIGIRNGAELSRSDKHFMSGNIVVYGTSITQGSAASRPGMCYPSILARRLDKQFFNLGFSGSGYFDPVFAPLLLVENPELIILDCTPNSNPEVIRKNLPGLVSEIRSRDNDVPILLIESIIRVDAHFKPAKMKSIELQNTALKNVFDSLKSVPNLYYLNSDLIGDDSESTIDGTHLTDLGFMRISDKIEKKILEILHKYDSIPMTR